MILKLFLPLTSEKQALEQRYAEEKYRSKNIEMKFEQGNNAERLLNYMTSYEH